MLAELHEITFYTIGSLNEHLRILLKQLNEEPFQKREGSRSSQFHAVDLPAMRPLPAQPYLFREWRVATVNTDYHIEVYKAYYSVPYRYARRKVRVCLTEETVAIFLNGACIAMHRTCDRERMYRTNPDHMPSHHQDYAHQERLLAQAEAIGPCTAQVAAAVMERKKHPEQGYRTIRGILNLSRRYGPDRVELACRWALAHKAFSYDSIANILRNGMDRLSLYEDDEPGVRHENIRGADYYADPNNQT